MVAMLNPGASVKLLVLLALNLASMQVVDALAPLGRIYRADGSFLDARALAIPVAGYNAFSRKRQADTIGSWALLTGTCPDGTVECKTSYTEGKPCCPSSSTCYTDFSQINCCPTSSDCSGSAATFPKCGDPSWTLWKVSETNYFCCNPGEVGYITINKNGGCGPSTLKPTGNQVASMIAQGTGQGPVPTSSSNHGTTTTTSLSKTTSTSSTTTSVPPTPSSSSSTSTTVTESPNTSGGLDQTTGGDQSASSTGASSSNSSSSSSGLSTGVIAGIVVGAVVILILAGLGIYFARQAGRRQGVTEAITAFQQQQQQLSPGNNYQSGSTVPGVSPSVVQLPTQPYAGQPISPDKYDQESQFTTTSPMTSPQAPDVNRYAEMDTNHLGPH